MQLTLGTASKVNDQRLLAAVSIALGLLAATLLFVPFVAIMYRRRGQLRGLDVLLYLAVLIYAWAIWVFTLAPFPNPEQIVCVGKNLNPLQFIHDLRSARLEGNGLRDPLSLQLIYNVALFMPLGFFVRVLGRRGVVLAGGAGLTVSVIIETTQLTGIWGIYSCAYRVFDVNDMITNTTGAIAGSLVGLLVPRRSAPAEISAQRPVTRSRRLLGMLCDWLATMLLAMVIAVGTQLLLRYGLHREDLVRSGRFASTFSSGAVITLTFLLVLSTGRSWGDWATQLRFGTLHQPVISRMLRYLGGIGGYLLITAASGVGSGLGIAFVVVSFGCAWRTPYGGLPGWLSRQHLTDAREPEPPQKHDLYRPLV